MPPAACYRESMNFAISIDGAVRIHAVIACIASCTCIRALSGALSLLVDLSEDSVHLLGEAFLSILDFIHIATLADLLESIHFGLEGVLILIRELVGIVAQLLLRLIDQGISAVALSLAETCTMPLRSMENVTSICGTPRGAGAMLVSWKRPRDLLS